MNDKVELDSEILFELAVRLGESISEVSQVVAKLFDPFRKATEELLKTSLEYDPSYAKKYRHRRKYYRMMERRKK